MWLPVCVVVARIRDAPVQSAGKGWPPKLGGADRQTLFIVAAEWRGFEQMVSDARTGQVLSVEAPAPGVGWP